MFAKLEEVEKRYDHLNERMSDPKVIARQSEFQQYAREQSELAPVVNEFRELKKLRNEREGNDKILNEETDEEMLALAREEVGGLKKQIEQSEQRIKVMLLPRDPRDERGVIMEIRAGTGGEEASLFAADLFRMYTRYAENQKWKSEILSQSQTGKGGFKEVILNIQGKAVYSKLKFESGTHRVQRVPDTESQGRVHTSAVTVAILPQVDDIDIKINPTELKIDVFRSSKEALGITEQAIAKGAKVVWMQIGIANHEAAIKRAAARTAIPLCVRDS
ncbi:MAG: PCRF domain-containing protein [Nitrospinae bacterium]|nr:PCRF domain-containing protein [Nitrospinota bacterium]